ncbi:MAG: NifB/NifX family molybdenum-iron cluster-binding protein [Anaerolineales bacterium]|nr:NifB/NifX family molybdenum-iron cluster-binding protein [Anaerolineales bacterium]
MKLAITATQPNMEAPFDPRFGRCAYFIVVDDSDRSWQAFPNPAIDSRGGAGTQAAQFIAKQGVKAVVSGSYGPNAHAALLAAGIRMFEAQAGNPASLLDAYLGGQLQEIASPTSPGYHSRRRF